MSKRAIIFALLSLCLVFTACAEPGAVDAASVFGTVEGDTYENTLLSIGCKLKGWHYNSKEEMMTLNNIALDMLGEEFSKKLEQSEHIMVMSAINDNSTKNVNIMLQNMDANWTMIGDTGLRLKMEAALPEFRASLESTGFTDVDMSMGEAIIGEETLSAFVGSYTFQGTQVFLKQPWIFRGNYLCTISVSTYQADTTDEVLKDFYLME